MVKLCVDFCICLYMNTQIYVPLSFMQLENKLISKLCDYSTYPRHVTQYVARKKCKFPISLTSAMGDAHLCISSPTPRKNEYRCSNQHTVILSFKTLSAIFRIINSTLEHSWQGKSLSLVKETLFSILKMIISL